MVLQVRGSDGDMIDRRACHLGGRLGGHLGDRLGGSGRLGVVVRTFLLQS